jgi:subfamily B ATP-binding cassette protein MsbA
MNVVRLLLGLLRPQRKRIAILVAVLLALTIVEVVLWPAAFGAFVKVLPISQPTVPVGNRLLRSATEWFDQALEKGPGERQRLLVIIAIATVIITLVRNTLTYIRDYTGQYVGGRALIDLRMQLFTRLQHLSLAFYDSQRVGDLMSRLTNDVSLVQQLVTTDLVQYATAPPIIIGGTAMMFVWNWKLSLFMVVFAPLTTYAVSWSGRRIARLTRSQQERIGDLNARLHERLASMRIIQSFVREEYEVGEFRRLNESTFRALMRVARLGALAPQVIQLFSLAALVVAATYAGFLMIGGDLNFPLLTMYFFLAQRVGIFFVKFGSLQLRVSQALGALGRLMELLGQEPQVQESPDAVALPPAQGRVSFRDVTFRYGEGDVVLEGVSLDISPGEVVALVGPSGAGKTSMANLVMRFYDPTSGRVEVDGHDVRGVTLRSLRSQIGLVPQETILFGGTIRENILYGRAEATDEEVIAAARAANAHEFISALPNGYDSEVGERAVKLSGGQRQRIAVARALLKDPRILILDEATSSLDAESEALVQEALERLMNGRTTLVIAHRLSTIRRATRILVLSDGRVVEQGRHEELLSAGGVYSRLYGAQERSAGLGEAVTGSASDAGRE